MKLRISSRQSELAQFQAYQVGETLQAAYAGLEIEYLFRESLGDKNQQDPLWKMPEKGVFTEDFYADLINEKTDMVVHSWKDLPTEIKPETFIAATLPRADQRDFLLFKRSSRNKKSVRIFSSSPRRALNLKGFLKWALPWETNVEFENVRGNIPTRVRKWKESFEIDGLVLAKAALDRLLDGKRFVETKSFLQEVLNTSDWMVLPLTHNPNAAAQGALAIEVKSSRQDVVEVLKKINCEKSYKSAQTERDILKTFGGGCHLALGMSSLQREYGEITIVKGLTPDGSVVDEKKLNAVKKIPNEIKKVRLEFKHQREALALPELKDLNALYVSKAEAWQSQLKFDGLVWASGCETWKKLAAQGVWVSGCNESLGESEDFRIEHFYDHKLNWGRLSHADANPKGNKKHLASYQIKSELLSENIENNCAFIWTSPQEFDLAVTRFPSLKSQLHICGSGRTYEALSERLGSTEKLFIEIF